MNFVGNLILFLTVKEFWQRFDKVTVISLVAYFLEHSVNSK